MTASNIAVSPLSPLSIALYGGVGMATAMGLGRFAYTPILPEMMSGLGLTAYDGGVIASANFLGYLLGAFGASMAWATGREVLLLRLGLMMTVVMSFAMSLSSSIIMFCLFRFLSGFASAFAMVMVSMVVFNQLSLADRDDLQAAHYGGVGFGIALSSLALGITVAVGLPWQADWLVVAALGVLGCIIALPKLNTAPVTTIAGSKEGPLPKSPELKWLIIGYGFFGAGYIVLATFLMAMIRANIDLPWFEAFTWFVTGCVAAVSVFLWNPFVRRFGLRNAVIAGCLVEALGILAALTLPLFAGILLAGIGFGLTFIMATAYGLRLAQRMAPQAKRRVFALMTASFGTGQMLGPIIAGRLTENTGNFSAGNIFAIFCLLVSAGATAMVKDRK